MLVAADRPTITASLALHCSAHDKVPSSDWRGPRCCVHRRWPYQRRPSKWTRVGPRRSSCRTDRSRTSGDRACCRRAVPAVHALRLRSARGPDRLRCLSGPPRRVGVSDLQLRRLMPWPTHDAKVVKFHEAANRFDQPAVQLDNGDPIMGKLVENHIPHRLDEHVGCICVDHPWCKPPRVQPECPRP